MPGRVEVHAFESRLLAGNPLRDPARREPIVWLPEAYDREPGRRFPVLFALQGFTGTARHHLNVHWYAPSLPERLDRLVGSGRMAPVVVLMVDGMTAVGGNQWIDSSAVGPWASHVVEELVPWAERTFRLLPGRAHRGVFGKSSGGYGALMMALEHADAFSAAVSHSGDCYFEYAYGCDFPAAADGLRAEGGLAEFLAKVRRRHWPKFPGSLFPALNVVAMAHFYSPDPRAPFGFRLPFAETTGERSAEVMALWARRDPVHLVAERAADLRTLSLLWFDCGTRDQFHLHHGARILAERLRGASVPFVHEEFDDDHSDVGYRMERSLPVLAEAVSRGA
jgi:S-formylglutathione hydrolase FrmB